MTAISKQERISILQRANTVRLARAALKKRVHAGELRVPDLLREPPEEIRSLPVGDLMMWEFKAGYRATVARSRMVQLLSRLLIPERKPVGGLTERQRLLLASRMEERS